MPNKKKQDAAVKKYHPPNQSSSNQQVQKGNMKGKGDHGSKSTTKRVQQDQPSGPRPAKKLRLSHEPAPGCFVDNHDFVSIDGVSNTPQPKSPSTQEKFVPSAFDPPWAKANYCADSLNGLHREILDFANFLQPTPSEIELRADLIQRVKKVATDLWPNCKVSVFGSVLTELYLPSSDIDILVTGETRELPGALYILSLKMSEEISDPTDIQVLATAKVPIVKFVDKKSRIPVDLCFHQAGGLANSEIVQGLLARLPALRPLVIVIKYFLGQRNLNEPYTGGLGSYALTLMVAFFLDQWKKRNPEKVENYGILLIEFLALYGRDFNYFTTGVSVRQGSFYAKAERGWIDPEKPYRLSVEDPQDISNDVGRPSFQILNVSWAFKWAYSRLVFNPDVNEPMGNSFLARVLSKDDELIARASKAKFSHSKCLSRMLQPRPSIETQVQLYTS